MGRRRAAAMVLAAVVISLVAGWVAASRIKSPAEVAARTAPPAASPILVPAEERVLSTDIVTRGTARFGSPQTISLTPSALKPDGAVLTRLPLPGAELSEGDIALSASGRPVFILTGAVPTFRDLGPGLVGDDVSQLESALARLGFDPGPLDGLYDSRTESAVARWYETAGFAPFEATAEQLSAIRSLEMDLASARLDRLNSSDAIATAQADLAAASSSYATAVALAAGGPGAIAAAVAEAEANTLSAASDVATAEAALSALTTPAVPTASEISDAEAAVTLAESSQDAIRLAGIRAIANAQILLDNAPIALSAAQADALTADLAARGEVVSAQAVLDAVMADPASSAADLAAAQTALTLAESVEAATRLTGEQAIAEAQAVLDGASAGLSIAQTDATAADLAAAAEVAAARTALDRLNNPIPASTTDITAAERDLAAARATATSTRLAGEASVAAARVGSVGEKGDVDTAAAAVTSARTALTNARSASSSGLLPAADAQGVLDAAKQRAGVQVPADELIFVPNAPLRVAEVTALPGDPAVGSIMTATDAIVAVDSSLPLEEVALAEVGMTVMIDEPDLGIEATGTLTRVAETPGTDGVDGFHVYIEITVDGSPANLVGSSVRLTIPVESTGGSVLAVPVSALSLAADGSSRVQHDDGSGLVYTTVEPGLSAAGFVGVTPIDGTLAVGDLVVVGFDLQAAGGG